MELGSKVVFVTGGAQGFGKAFAEAVLEKGAKVFLGDLNSTVGSETLKEFQERFGAENVRFDVFDVTDHQQFTDAFNRAVSEFGHVDVLVNNAGILDESRWEKVIQTNFISLVHGTFLATEHMRKDKGGRGGRIINISSLAGLIDVPTIPVYCATKHAVRSFTSSLALHPNIEQMGIEYGILCPDTTSTELVRTLNAVRVPLYDEFMNLIEGTVMQVTTVVDAFMELLQLEKMNGAILLVKLGGKSYQRVESHTV